MSSNKSAAYCEVAATLQIQHCPGHAISMVEGKNRIHGTLAFEFYGIAAALDHYATTKERRWPFRPFSVIVGPGP